MYSILVFVGIGSIFCKTISGITLTSSSAFGFASGFSLTCQVQGAITTQMTIRDPAGNVAAGCLQPPSGCGSADLNTFERNIQDGTFTVNIIQTNVDISGHKGTWTCTDGNNIAQFEIKDIFSTSVADIQSEVVIPITGTVITVLIGCIYPYPDEITISYVKESSPSVILKSRNDVIFDNGTSTNCPIPDVRAISMNGTFKVSTDNLNGYEARIAVTVLLNGTEKRIGLSNFTIPSEKSCNYSAIELFLGGFSCFLIVVITTITMLIILGCKILPEIFGDLSTKKKTIKIIIIVVFIVVALIIGLALGFGLKECNQRNLGLGLGLGLGFLLAIALVVTLFIYHRQCDSKKENEDENRESPTEIKSKKPEDNHKRVGLNS